MSGTARPTSDLVNRLWGSGDLHSVFGDASKVVAPWPRASKRKNGADAQTQYTKQILEWPVWLSEIDPRILFASQGWVVRQHAEYYATGEWEVTGVTSADRESDANRFPVVVCDLQGRHIISTGHHRALVALVEGRPLRCRRAPDTSGDAVALLPRLLFGSSTRLQHVRCETVEAAVAAVRRGDTALCPDLEVVMAAGAMLSPTLPHRHFTALEPVAPEVVVPIERPQPRQCATGLCTTCGGLTSALDGLSDALSGDRCRCEPRPTDQTAQESEQGMACALCQVCRLQVVGGHTRWRLVICESCRPRAVAFNARFGRRVLLPGIHSIVNGGPVLTGGNRASRDAQIVGFADQLSGMLDAVSAYRRWSETMLLRRLAALGFEPGRVIPLDDYLLSCAAAGIDQDTGWAELEAHVVSSGQAHEL